MQCPAQALECDPGFCTETFLPGLKYHQAGRIPGCAFRRSSRYRIPKWTIFCSTSGLATIIYKRGLFADAVGEYQKALTLNPNYADIRNHLGIAYSAQGLTTEAIREFQYALAINPRYVEAMLNLGINLCGAGKKNGSAPLVCRSVEDRAEQPHRAVSIFAPMRHNEPPDGFLTFHKNGAAIPIG